MRAKAELNNKEESAENVSVIDVQDSDYSIVKPKRLDFVDENIMRTAISFKTFPNLDDSFGNLESVFDEILNSNSESSPENLVTLTGES